MMVLLIWIAAALAGGPSAAIPAVVSTSDQAITLARQYLGLDQWEAELAAAGDTVAPRRMRAVTSAVRAVPPDDRTPFFHDRIAGGQVWVVRMDSLQLGLRDVLLHNLTMLVDAETGALLSIEGRSVAPDSSLLPRLRADLATAQLRQAREAYELADTIPPLSLYEATQIELGGCLSGVREFDAQCVWWSHLDNPARLVWVLTLRGLTPPSKVKGKVPDWQVNHERYVIDATTGHVLTITNFPHTQPPPWDTLGQAK